MVAAGDAGGGGAAAAAATALEGVAASRAKWLEKREAELTSADKAEAAAALLLAAKPPQVPLSDD